MSPVIDPVRTKKILTLGLPIVGGMISQNVLNLVDTAMVGVLGAPALAAVGTGSFANFMATAFVTGFSSGVQAIAARRKGEGREEETALPLNGGLLMALVISVPASLLLVWLAPMLFPYLNSDPEVVRAGGPYLQARLVAMAAVGMNFSFRGYWNAVERSGLYLRTLLFMHVANIILNYGLIFGKLGMPELGAVGAGIGSAVATFMGTAYYFYLGFRHARPNGFLRAIPGKQTIRQILRLSLPTSIQQLFFAAGFTTLFWILGKMGTAETGAANVVINVMLVAILPGLALGLASASLVGQALGRGEPEDARRWGWDVVKVAVVAMTGLGGLMLAFPEPILSIFLHEQESLTIAGPALMIFGATIAADACGMVLMNSLLGAGAARRVMAVSIGFQWGLFLPASYVVGPVLGYGLWAVWTVQAVQRALQAAVFAAIWQRGRWASIEV